MSLIQILFILNDTILIGLHWVSFSLFKKNSPPRTCLLILDWGEGRGWGREREKEGDINLLPPISALTRDQTQDLLLHGTKLSLTEPPSGGSTGPLLRSQTRLIFRISWRVTHTVPYHMYAQTHIQVPRLHPYGFDSFVQVGLNNSYLENILQVMLMIDHIWKCLSKTILTIC